MEGTDEGYQNDNRPEDRWIQTFSGKRFFPLNPDPTDIEINDIAHALSNTCRFTGHSRVFYSVAEHSLHISGMLRDRGYDNTMQLWGLLHDASEAYLPDVARPIKSQIEGFDQWEERILDAVMEAFGLPQDISWAPIKQADTELLLREMDELLPGNEARETLDGYATADTRLRMWRPEWARYEFLKTFYALMANRARPQEKPPKYFVTSTGM